MVQVMSVADNRVKDASEREPQVKSVGIAAAAPLMVPIPAASCTPIAHSVPSPPPKTNTGKVYAAGTSSSASTSSASRLTVTQLPQDNSSALSTYDTYLRTGDGFFGHGGDRVSGHGGVDRESEHGENRVF